jgi:5-methyltetrahydropteroyltriglutamate--homocysteine methyltransferase
MVRWFNTNTFYQTPVVTGELGTKGSVFSSTVERAVTVGKRPCKVMVPDPLTFAELSEDRFYGSREKLLFAFSDRVLAEELRALEKRGVRYVQFSSPSLVARFGEKPVSRDLLGQLGESIRGAVKGTTIKTGFYTFFGDASTYIPSIFDLIPTDDIGFDLTETDLDSITPTRKGIIAGVSDARTTYLETLQELTAKVVTISDRTASKSITLSPSADLRYIPRASADTKLRRLAELKERVVAS